ncbi:MAG: hypothetical protein ACOCV1_08450 [Bacillota bacterium]
MSGFEFHDSEFKELEKKVGKAKEKINGRVDLLDLLTDNFIKENTNYNSFDEMVKKSELNFSTEERSAETFESDKWNNYVQEKTGFEGWQEMIEIASREYIIKILIYRIYLKQYLSIWR